MIGLEFNSPLKIVSGFCEFPGGKESHAKIEMAVRELFSKLLPLAVRACAGELSLNHVGIQFHIPGEIVIISATKKRTCDRAHQQLARTADPAAGQCRGQISPTCGRHVELCHILLELRQVEGTFVCNGQMTL